MEAGSLVVCVKGHPGVIEFGEIYTVREILLNNSLVPVVHLLEVSPPEGYNGFRIDRFLEIQGPMDVNELLKEVFIENENI